MNDKNKAIDEYLRRGRKRKFVMIAVAAILFVAFMTYALYMEYG